MGAYGIGFSNITDFYAMLYGTAGVDFQTMTLWQFASAAGVVANGNPPFTVTDFLSFYPKFFGLPTQFTELTITQNSQTISGFSSTTDLSPGQLVVNPSFAKDTLIATVASNSITVTNEALTAGTTLTVYEAPFVPIVVILSFTFLACVSVMQARYHGMWAQCVAWFIAHYLTLYMRTESGPNLTASEVASSGLTKGILISRHAGDVGAQSQLIASYEQWGAWTETQYGEQFITVARATNAGPIWVQ